MKFQINIQGEKPVIVKDIPVGSVVTMAKEMLEGWRDHTDYFKTFEPSNPDEVGIYVDVINEDHEPTDAQAHIEGLDDQARNAISYWMAQRFERLGNTDTGARTHA